MPAKQEPKGKVTVQCPHCGFKQLESDIAKSTFCRKCSGHFEIGEEPALQLSTGGTTSFFKKIESLFGNKGPKIIHCFECGRKQEVSPSAQSSICPHCSAYIDLQDFKIAGTFSRNLRTRGYVYVTSKGDLSSSKVICGSSYIQGQMRGNIICDGETLVKLKGKITGSVDSARLIIERRADVTFVRPVKSKYLEIRGKMSGRIICDGTVVIAKGGQLEGEVFARAITVEKGGKFQGELQIGKQETAQQELLPPEEQKPQRSRKSGKDQTAGSNPQSGPLPGNMFPLLT